MRRVGLWVLLCGGCDASGQLDAKTPAVDGDSDTDTDTDSDTDADADADAAFTVEIRHVVAPGAGWRVGAWLGHATSTDLTFDREAASEAVSAWPAQLDLVVPRRDIGDLGDGSQGAYFWLFAYDDLDGNGAHDSGEPIAAASPDALLFIDDPAADGYWFGIRYVPSFAYFDPALGFDLWATGAPGPLNLAGTDATTGPPTSAPDRIASFTEDELWSAGPLVAGRPVEQALTDPFAIAISADPVPARIVVSQGYRYAVEYPEAYRDQDGSGSFTAGDTIVSNLCAGTRPVYLYWTPPAGDIESALTTVFYDAPTGWTAWDWDPGTSTSTRLVNTAGLTVSNTACPWF